MRHPPYLAAILLGIGLSLIVKHGLVGLPRAAVAMVSHLDSFEQ